MIQEKRIVLLEQLGRFIGVVEGIMARAKVREDRNAIAVQLARLEQGIAGVRELWNIPSLVDC